MSNHYDSLETRNPAEREHDLFARLPKHLAHTLHASGWQNHLAGIDPHVVTSRAALAKLPVLRKSDFVSLQKADPPFARL